MAWCFTFLFTLILPDFSCKTEDDNTRAGPRISVRIVQMEPVRKSGLDGTIILGALQGVPSGGGPSDVAST
jgi:hypothetical protein